jgi:antitoxin ParD1/3/4
MPTRNVNLTDDLESCVLAKVNSGRYENASEVVRAALRTLEREEQEFEVKLVALRAAIDEGEASGVAKAIPSSAFARASGFPGSGASSPWQKSSSVEIAGETAYATNVDQQFTT